MNSSRLIRNTIILAVLLTTIGCDQISKTVVRSKVEYYETISIIANYVTLTKVENAGAFLSVGDSLAAPLKVIFLSIMPLLGLAYGLFLLFTKTNISKTMLLGLCLVIGGGFGNIYDRLIYGSVTDFLHIDFVIFQTGIFNMADVSIMIGMFLILIQAFINRASLATADDEG